MTDAGVALIGGSIGSVLTAISVAILRLSAVPGDVARHDRRAHALDEDLERWVADDHRALRQELRDIIDDYAGRELLNSSMAPGALADAKTRALQRYRDRFSESERALSDLDAAESWPHDVWRHMRRRPALALHAPQRVAPVIEEWRRPVHGMTHEAVVHDPTLVTTDDLLREVREWPLLPRTEPDAT